MMMFLYFQVQTIVFISRIKILKLKKHGTFRLTSVLTMSDMVLFLITVKGCHIFKQTDLAFAEFSETPNPAYFNANFSCCTPKKSFRRFFRTPVFSISTCIIIVDFSLCSDQRRGLGVKISYCQQIKKITEALHLSAWCLSENGRRGVHVASACRNS